MLLPIRGRHNRCDSSAGLQSMAMTRACLVPGLAAVRNVAEADRLRDVGLPILSERVVAFGLDLGLIMGSSEVCATLSVAPPQPRPANRLQGTIPKASFSRPGAPRATLQPNPKASQTRAILLLLFKVHLASS